MNMSTIITLISARLGEARPLFVVGVTFALIGTMSLALTALVAQLAHQRTEIMVSRAHRTYAETPVPQLGLVNQDPPASERLLLMRSGGLECMSEEIITCTAQLKRDASPAEVAAYLHTEISTLRKLNPHMHGNRLK
jgi:hypothetical protein